MTEPWLHVRPVVEALLEQGNALARGGFQAVLGGFECELERPLDLDLVRRLTSRDQNVHIAEADDMFWCDHCWSSVFGPLRSAADLGRRSRR